MTIVGGATDVNNLIHHRNFPLLMYFSFVTLCSLGYGDILPVTPAARMLATAEAIVGQFYLAIFVARLISLYLQHTQKKDQ